MILTLVKCLVVLVSWHLPFVISGPGYKGWFVKYVTPDLYTAGRLTELQIKYASEVGFKSLVSLSTGSTEMSAWGEVLLATQDAKMITEQLTDMQFAIVNGEGVPGATKESVEKFAQIYQNLTKPVLLYCDSSRISSLVALLYQIYDDIPDWDASLLYKHASVMGYDYYSDENSKKLIETVSNEVVTDPAMPDVTLDNWDAKYWWMKPLYKNWFVAAQIKTNQLDTLEQINIKSVINVRLGVTFGGNKSQEEVVLLNIMDETGTYNGTGRQTTEELEKIRIDPNKPNRYISADYLVNYESRNPLHFGDDIGYNETLERLAVEDRFLYFHNPIKDPLYPLHLFDYKNEWLEANKSGIVLVHCSSAYRAAVLGLMAVGNIYNKSLEWALERASMMGFPFKEDDVTAVIDLLDFTLPFDYINEEPGNTGFTVHNTQQIVTYIMISLYLLAFVL